VGNQPGWLANLIRPDWRTLLQSEFSSPRMTKLESFLAKEYSSGPVYPPREVIFNAFNSSSLDGIKVLILGQGTATSNLVVAILTYNCPLPSDPYHGAGQAHGLCFSVQPGVDVPPSLVNIYKSVCFGHPCTSADPFCFQGIGH